MLKIKNYTGYSKVLLNLKIKLVTFVYFLGQLLKGKFKPKYFFRVLRRLLFFLSYMKQNKYVKIGNRLKIQLYLPGFPSKAYFHGCNKVTVFDEKMPSISALISLTSACRYKCPHCYQKHDKGKDVDIDVLVATVKKIQNNGTAFFNIEGGEPFLVFDRLKRVCDAIDERSEILINSTGDGMTFENLSELRKNKNIIGVMFSLHTDKPELANKFMGVDYAWENLVKGVELCHKVGLAVTFNTCLLKDAFYDGTFERLMVVAKDFNGSILQLIKPKPAGGWLDSGLEDFTETDVAHVSKLVHRYNMEREYRDYPFISPMILEESSQYFGCTAGGTDRFYINAKGDLQACEFLNLSFGNIQTDDFDEIYGKMRKVFEKPCQSWLCEKYSCQVHTLKKENELKSLPLSTELSREVYESWDRESVTDFYQKLEDL
ncbi:MAG: radical SAM protein [Bacteroidales bacterium]|nr:radical SAM protein [Bacteroidales bacterium]MCF8455563.1 radical SAM protein [Bacteroidales bacterium]